MFVCDCLYNVVTNTSLLKVDVGILILLLISNVPLLNCGRMYEVDVMLTVLVIDWSVIKNQIIIIHIHI